MAGAGRYHEHVAGGETALGAFACDHAVAAEHDPGGHALERDLFVHAFEDAHLLDHETIAGGHAGGGGKDAADVAARLADLVVGDVESNVGQSALDVEFSALAGGIDSVPVVQSIGHVGRSLDFGDQHSGAQGVRDAAGQKETVAGLGAAALEQIDALLVADGAALREFSYFAPEVAFLRGYALLLDLEFDESQKALRAFLAAHPDASERLRMSASQMLAELANRSTGDIGEVADLMGFSGRRLASGDTGTEVQERQQRILDLLDKLVENAENNENNSGGGGSGGGQGRSPQSPLPRSVLPPGSAREGTLREARRASPGEVWGNMPPADRERILQALRESFPDRYRRLVEQYYEELAKKP